MRTQTTSLINKLSKETVKNLTNEVKETLAYGFNSNHTRTFSAADCVNKK